MNPAIPQAPPTENIYGIAKRISLDLEKLPLHTHAAIINVVNTMCQHRKLVLETEMQMQQLGAQEAAMADARKAHAERQVQQDAEIRRAMAPAMAEGVHPGRVETAQPKAPRLSIVLGDSNASSDATGFVDQPETAAETAQEVAVS